MTNPLSSPWAGALGILISAIWAAASSGAELPPISWPVGLFLVSLAQSIYTLVSENVSLKKSIEPKLKLVDGIGPPYSRVKPLYKRGTRQRVGSLEILSVGVVNEGATTAPKVAVKILEIEPPDLQQYWPASLHVANKKQSVWQRDIHSSKEPQWFYEVVSQSSYPDEAAASSSLRIRFAGDLFEKRLPLKNRYFITLAIDGSNAGPPVRFVLLKNDKNRWELRRALDQRR